MAPHLTSSELDQILEWKGHKRTKEIHGMLAEQRTRQGVQPFFCQQLGRLYMGIHTAVGAQKREAGNGACLLAPSKAWIWHVSVCRKVDPTTAARRMRAAGKDVKRHRPREKPQRTPEHMEERARRAKRMRNLSEECFSKEVEPKP